MSIWFNYLEKSDIESEKLRIDSQISKANDYMSKFKDKRVRDSLKKDHRKLYTKEIVLTELKINLALTKIHLLSKRKNYVKK